jgi:hypothetical protein
MQPKNLEEAYDEEKGAQKSQDRIFSQEDRTEEDAAFEQGRDSRSGGEMKGIGRKERSPLGRLTCPLTLAPIFPLYKD